MNIEELYMCVSACRALYVQDQIVLYNIFHAAYHRVLFSRWQV